MNCVGNLLNVPPTIVLIVLHLCLSVPPNATLNSDVFFISKRRIALFRFPCTLEDPNHFIRFTLVLQPLL